MFGLLGREKRDPGEICVEVTEALRAALPECRLRVAADDPLSVEAAHPDEDIGTLQLYLGNIVRDIQSGWTSSHRAKLISAYVSMAQAAVYPPPITLDNVYLMVRNRAYFAQMNDGWADDALVRDGPGDLVTLVFADLGEGLQNVTTAAGKKFGFSPGDVMAAAEANLMKILPTLRTWVSETGVVSAGFKDHDWLGTSLLLMPKALQIVMLDAGWERALISSVSRESVDLVNLDDPEALDMMEDWMRQLGNSDPRPQSDFVWTMAAGDAGLVRTHKFADDRLVVLS